MKVFRALADLPGEPLRPVATLGNFDGVHVGHQRILSDLTEHARRLETTTLVMTFEPHPREVLRPDVRHRAIASLDDRLEAFERAGMGGVFVIPFDREFARVTAGQFVDELLVGSLGVQAVHVGPFTTFGHKRGGDPAFLRAAGARHGFEVIVTEPVDVLGARVSSSRVRDAIGAGDVALARELLGRPHRLTGEVVHGDGRGRELGFPTANVAVAGGQLPANGVYSAWVRVCGDEGGPYAAVLNIGLRPTVDGTRHAVEVHLLDEERDLYGRTLQLELVGFHRQERRFDGLDALSAQIAKDARAARELLAEDAAP